PLSGDDDDRCFRIDLLELAYELDAVHVGHHHGVDDGVGRLGSEQCLSAGADAGSLAVEARVIEQNLEPFGHSRLIVYGEYALLTFQTHTVQSVAIKRNVSIHIRA